MRSKAPHPAMIEALDSQTGAAWALATRQGGRRTAGVIWQGCRASQAAERAAWVSDLKEVVWVF